MLFLWSLFALLAAGAALPAPSSSEENSHACGDLIREAHESESNLLSNTDIHLPSFTKNIKCDTELSFSSSASRSLIVSTMTCCTKLKLSRWLCPGHRCL